MSLLVTSCTMGKQPDRLLDKGPEYLRTRTNRGLFAHHRKSAVELLAASKAQFYKVPSTSAHERHELIQPSDDTHSHGQKPHLQLQRSKSEFDVSTLQTLTTIDDCFAEPEESSSTKVADHNLCNLKDTSLQSYSEKKASRRASVGVPTAVEANVVSPTTSVKSNPSTLYHSMTVHNNIYSEESQKPPLPQKISSNTKAKIPGKPTPLPRKHFDKPVPPPRKPKVPQRPSKVSHGSEDNTPSVPNTPSPDEDVIDGVFSSQECETSVTGNLAAPKRKRSLVETLAQHFTSLCTDFQFSSSPFTKSPAKEEEPSHTKGISENSKKECSTDTLYKAKPICISPEGNSQNTHFKAKPVFIYPTTNTCQNQISDDANCVRQCQNPSDSNNNVKGRKRYPELPMSNKFSSSKRERKTLDTETIPTSPLSQSDAHYFNSVSASSKGPALEMSIESVERVVYDSEVSAIPAAITTSVDSLDHAEPREVKRVNSSLSGKMDAQDASSHLLHSPTHPIASVPRSHSDISCRLEGQHSRDSSLVSNCSRFSRASAGADLEKFFNQMGLERGILEPISQLKALQGSEVLASVSSLDSHDASSIGSTFSGSENDCSESKERSQQPTSVVERNARIIKWLCNVRRAKSQSLNLDGAAAKSSTASSAAGNA